MQRARVAILGASGYTGVELTRLVAAHPELELVVASSDRWAGDTIEQRVGVGGALPYVAPERALEDAASCAAVLLATPAEISHALVPRLRETSRSRAATNAPILIDLSGAFRMKDPAAYANHYGFAHAQPTLLHDMVYGLPELFRARVRGARLVANPGCYATAIQLALAPVAKLAAGRIAVDAVSGVTGAGRKATEELSFAEVAGDVRAYRTLRHQHAPEIEQGLADHAGSGVSIAFVAHLVPIARGILATCHVPLAGGTTSASIDDAFARAYADEPFIILADGADAVSIHDVVGTNRCKVGWTLDRDHLVVTSAIDNLVKGAAGQAIQNLNLALGLPETTGLARLRGFHP